MALKLHCKYFQYRIIFVYSVLFSNVLFLSTKLYMEIMKNFLNLEKKSSSYHAAAAILWQITGPRKKWLPMSRWSLQFFIHYGPPRSEEPLMSRRSTGSTPRHRHVECARVNTNIEFKVMKLMVASLWSHGSGRWLRWLCPSSKIVDLHTTMVRWWSHGPPTH